MRSGYLLAGASILHAATAIPAYITTVFNCPDVVTITQTVYPPGWTATGPISGWNSDTPYYYEPSNKNSPPYYYEPSNNPPTTCVETAPVTTSWETEYATTTVYYSELGMYKGPPGCPSEIIAYMPTTVTCSEPRTTGWVGYSEDIACASCTATTLVGLEPSYAVASGVTTTYVTVWTEVYVEQGATTQGSVINSQWIATGYTPTNVYPYAKICTGNPYPNPNPNHNPNPNNNPGPENYTPTVGGGYSYTHSQGAYPSIDYNNPNVFHGGQSVPIVSSGYQSQTQTYAPTNPTPAQEPPNDHQGPYTWTKGHYPSIDYSNPDYFKGGQGTHTYTEGGANPPATTTGPPANNPHPATATDGSRPTSYPIDYADPNVFRPIQSSVGIVSNTLPPSSVPQTATYTAATSYTSNYASVDNNAPENFRPLSTGIEIVSLTGSQSNAAPTSTVTGQPTPISAHTAGYPSIDFNDPSVFKGLDPNAALTGGAPQPTA